MQARIAGFRLRFSKSPEFLGGGGGTEARTGGTATGQLGT